MKIMVTGGAGYIGTHTCVELLQAGHDVVVVDNLSNSSERALDRVRQLTGCDLDFVLADVRDETAMESVLTSHACEAVIHFAGLKSVGESVLEPLAYYDNNISGTLAVLRAMMKSGVKHLVFSSSATVYGEPTFLPLTEHHSLSATNPYGRTKLVAEEMLRDFHRANPGYAITLLRYFNPVGAHSSGRIGEDPVGVPNNLMPFIAQVAVGRRKSLNIWGDDYATRDGTGVRDYIHVVDLALGHLKAVEQAVAGRCVAINLGTGTGHSVMEVIKSFERASGRSIPYEICPRRLGDVAECYADARLAIELLGWQAKRNLDDMCTDHWRWQEMNPRGYA